MRPEPPPAVHFPNQPRRTWSALQRRYEATLVPSDVGRAAPATRGSFSQTNPADMVRPTAALRSHVGSVRCRAGRARHPRFIFPTNPADMVRPTAALRSHVGSVRCRAGRARHPRFIFPNQPGGHGPPYGGVTKPRWFRPMQGGPRPPPEVHFPKPTRRTWSALRRRYEATLVPSDVGRAAPATRGSFSQTNPADMVRPTAALRSHVGSVRCRAGRARHPRFIFPTLPRRTWSARRKGRSRISLHNHQRQKRLTRDGPAA